MYPNINSSYNKNMEIELRRKYLQLNAKKSKECMSTRSSPSVTTPHLPPIPTYLHVTNVRHENLRHESIGIGHEESLIEYPDINSMDIDADILNNASTTVQPSSIYPASDNNISKQIPIPEYSTYYPIPPPRHLSIIQCCILDRPLLVHYILSSAPASQQHEILNDQLPSALTMVNHFFFKVLNN